MGPGSAFPILCILSIDVKHFRPRALEDRRNILQRNALHNVPKSLVIESFLPRASLRPVLSGGRSAAAASASTSHLHAEARTGGPGHG